MQPGLCHSINLKVKYRHLKQKQDQYWDINVNNEII